MTEAPLEEVIDESQFVGMLQTHAVAFFRVTNSLRGRRARLWNPKHYYQLIYQANELESFLDDFGARSNRQYSFLTELVASLRGFAQAGYCLSHMQGRLEPSYLIREAVGELLFADIVESSTRVLAFVRTSIDDMLKVAVDEASRLGMKRTEEEMPEENFMSVVVRQRLPRNMGVEDLPEEEQRILEVASKYLLACEMLDNLRPESIRDQEVRRRWLAQICTEEQARVYEATVHNLQSAYDTYIKDTLLEAGDQSLPALRGLASCALHLLEGVTFLTHFYERHENDVRSEAAKLRISEIIDRGRVQEAILNHLLRVAHRTLISGRSSAGELLRKYTNAQELEVELANEAVLHARPASLIVGIVNYYGTPVEMSVAGQRSNAASILELLLAIGAHPEEKKLFFRGDANPLKDIRLLFQHRLGEDGLHTLPDELGYLKNR